MAHFNLENVISESTKIYDAPITSGPPMRWQRKASAAAALMEQQSMGTRKSCGVRSKSATRLVGGLADDVSHKCSPGKTFTPGRSRNRSGPRAVRSKSLPKSGSKKSDRSPPRPSQDRFIPNRATTDMELSHHLLCNTADTKQSDGGSGDVGEDAKVEYQRQLTEMLREGQPKDSKILSFKAKAPQAELGHTNNLKVLYSAPHSTGPKKLSARHIPHQADRILDAPNLLDDYYLNLLSWSTNNHLAVALGTAVYLWNAGSGNITQLMDLEDEDESVSCVSFIKDGNILAVSTLQGMVQLWDISQQKLLRSMGGHGSRVGSLSWNAYILSSGCRTGMIHHHDVRVAEHHVGSLNGHTQEVCGLSWSPDGRYLASGGNDNVLNIWPQTTGHDAQPIHRLTAHQAAVKALSWCPWQSSLLASGGGTADRHIRFWNAANGVCLNSIDTGSQVCSILWSEEYKELISGHGYAQNQLTIWKYPSLVRLADLTGHTARVLCLALSPDGTTVASAAADETLRLWKCFAVDPTKKKPTDKAGKEKASSRSLLTRGIR